MDIYAITYFYLRDKKYFCLEVLKKQGNKYIWRAICDPFYDKLPIDEDYPVYYVRLKNYQTVDFKDRDLRFITTPKTIIDRFKNGRVRNISM